eukprot:gene4497-14655_t
MGGTKKTTYDVDLMVTKETAPRKSSHHNHPNQHHKGGVQEESDDNSVKEKARKKTKKKSKKENKKQSKEKEREKEKEKEKEREKSRRRGKSSKSKSYRGSDSSSSSDSSGDSNSSSGTRASHTGVVIQVVVVTSGDSDSSRGSEDEECSAMQQAWRYPFYSPSASYRQLDMICGSHQYSVCGFSLARSMGCGTRLCSDYFEVAGQMFRVETYPAGFTADTCRYMSVFLTTPGSINPNHILFEIAILDQSGKDRNIVETRGMTNGMSGHNGMGPFQCGPLYSTCRGIVAAVPKFIKSSYLAKHARRYIPRDMLAIRATVQVLRGWSSAPVVHHHMAGSIGGVKMGCQQSSYMPQVMPGSPTPMQASLPDVLGGIQPSYNYGSGVSPHPHAYMGTPAPLYPPGSTNSYLPMGPPSTTYFPPSLGAGGGGMPTPSTPYFPRSLGLGGMPTAGSSYQMDGMVGSPSASIQLPGMLSPGGMFPPSVYSPVGSRYGSGGGGNPYLQTPIASNYYY